MLTKNLPYLPTCPSCLDQDSQDGKMYLIGSHQMPLMAYTFYPANRLILKIVMQTNGHCLHCDGWDDSLHLSRPQ